MDEAYQVVGYVSILELLAMLVAEDEGASDAEPAG